MRNLIPRFVQEQYQNNEFEGSFHAVTIFVDVSGFTPMTQSLMMHGKHGAEVLADVMNGIFDKLVDAIYEWGGFVSIFAGDAFTAIFPVDGEQNQADMVARHVLACVADIQSLFLRHAIQTTPFGQFTLQFKVGLSFGAVEWGIMGNEAKTFFFRGDAIDGCAFSEHRADKGDVIFDESIARLLRKVLGITEIGQHITMVEKGYYRLSEVPQAAIQQRKKPKSPRRKALSEKVVRQFLPNALIEFKDIGEFRKVVPIFISFEGIATVQELQAWACVLLDNIKLFGGYFNQLDFGDKGGTVLCGFGAPVTYEDAIDRALNFILTIKDEVQGIEALAGLRFRAGMTYGTAYAGICGGDKRCVYTFYGEVVNLAARFMMTADWDEIFVSEPICRRTSQFEFQDKGRIQYKGFSHPIATHLLCSRKVGVRHQTFTGQMVGRQAELQQLRDFAAPIFAGQCAGIAYIFGEAGVGKSRLAYALLESLQAENEILWFNCPSVQIVRKPFNPFTAFFLRYFEQSPEQSADENVAIFENIHSALREALLSEHESLRKELVRTQPVLMALLGLPPSGSLWKQLDAKGRYENTLAAIKCFFLSQSAQKPVMIELEDGHWLDGDSKAVLTDLTRNIQDVPLMILSTLRYRDDGSKTTFELKDFKNLEIELPELMPDDVTRYAELELQGQISPEFQALLMEKTKGNPFFVQQLLQYFKEQDLLVQENAIWQLTARNVELPDSIQALLIARIDRLTEKLKHVVKAAAVIGREFDVALLSEVLQRKVLPDVKHAEKSQIWEEVQELLYIFKHALLRDAAYTMQLKARLQELHQIVAETMETLYTERLEQYYADLAYHYEHAEIQDKAIEYLSKAGDAAKAQYQNQQAIDLYDRLLARLQNVFGMDEVKIDTLLGKAEILELVGDWTTCQQTCKEALQLSKQIDDKCRMGEANRILGIIFRRTGQYDKAMICFEQAMEQFENEGDKAGIGRIYTAKGQVFDYKGDSEAAMTYYQKAHKISEELNDKLGIAKNASNIGIIYYELKGDYKAGMMWCRKSLQVFEELGENLKKSRVLNNIGVIYDLQGDYDAAVKHYEQALRIYEKLGDKRNIAMNLDNIGFVYKLQGNYDTAIAYLDRAITIGRELDNKYFLCGYFIDKADALFSLQRYAEAQVLNQEGLQIAQEVEKKEYILQGNVLSAKVDFALGDKNAPQRLENILTQTQDDEEIAAVHYELWKMTRQEKNRQTALNLYQTLYKDTPQIDYKTRIEEMNRNSL